MAYKDDAAGFRIAGAAGLERSANQQCIDCSVAVVVFVGATHKIRFGRLLDILALPRVIYERDCDFMLARLYWNLDRQRFIGGMRVQFVIGIADNLAVPGERTDQSFGFAADREPFNPLTVDP